MLHESDSRLGVALHGSVVLKLVMVEPEEMSLQTMMENGEGMGSLFHHWGARVEKVHSRDEREPSF